MARPRKFSDADAVRLVDSLYEQCGDHSRLKFSELEKHAAYMDMDVKAYDLRRNEAVLRRIAEIEALELNANSLEALAYKGLDIEGFIRSNKAPDKLKRSLSELDGRWRKLFDHAVSLSKRESSLSAALQKSESLANGLKALNAELAEKAASGHSQAEALKVENAYLRKMIREYLYPALADSILQSEHASRTSGANQTAIEAMTDGDVPSSLNTSVAHEQSLRSLENHLFGKLRLLAQEDVDDG